jgi:putative component of toxin-antitoxin plasmid stabilization module/DNA-binding phage protein
LEVRYYISEDGRSPFSEWFESLDSAARVRVATAIERLEAGNISGLKSVGAGVAELRIFFGPGYRVLGARGSALDNCVGRRHQATATERHRICKVRLEKIQRTRGVKRRSAPLTGSFRQLVQEHISKDPAFAQGMLGEGIQQMLAGDVETGKAILRNYIKATVGFEKLGRATGTQPKSLIRMFGPRGNPQARNLFRVIGYLQKHAGVELHVAFAAT